MAFEPVRRARRDPAACAIFGAISFSGSPLPGRLAVEGIREAETARGGAYGNGVMFANTERNQRGKTISIWARKDIFVDRIRQILKEEGVEIKDFTKPGSGDIYKARTESEYLPLLISVVRANSEISADEARIISFGHGLDLYKGLDSLSALEETYGLGGMSATAMIAHTRYPTGSQPKVARAHPFGFGNVGIVHNGDVTSFMANVGACEARLAEIYHPYSKIQPNGHAKQGVVDFLSTLRRSWVGTDSEIIAAMMYTLLKTGLMSEPGLSIGAIMSVLIPPFDNSLTRLLRGSAERERLDQLAIRYRGFGLDGPVSSIALITYEDEVQLIAFRDRNTFRPLQIVIDHESGRVFAASELRQIIAATGLDIFSSKVESYSPEPGKFLWVSSKSGIVTTGRSRRPFIRPPGLNGKPVDAQLGGSPHQFAGQMVDEGRAYRGILGNHGGSFSAGDGSHEIIGSIQDNCYDTSTLRRVVVHGNAGMMTANAFQGEQFFIRGSADSRAFQQFRPNPLTGQSPTGIIGETAGQYLGKMMSSGLIMVLGLEHLGREDVDTPIVGEFVGTGMVGGRIYIRGYVIDDFIKRPPQRREVIAVCAQLKEEMLISDSALREIRHNPLSLPRIRKILEGSRMRVEDPNSVEKAMQRLAPLFDSSLTLERRGLNERELEELGPNLEDYFQTFRLDEEGLRRVLSSNWTIIGVKDAQT